MDMSTIMTAYQSAKAAGEILSALGKLKIDTEVLGKIADVQHRLAEAQDGLFSAQSQLLELQSINSTLVQKIANLENWKQTLSQYELIATPGTAVVYSFKGSPAHYACPSCISKKELQLLQDQLSCSGEYQCPSCKSNFLIKIQQSSGDIYSAFRRSE